MLSLTHSFKLYICRDPRIARAYTAPKKNTKKKAHFSRVSLSVYPRSRRGAGRIRRGEGRCSRPPKTALERTYLTENSSSENRILRSRRKKTPDRIPPKKNEIMYIYIFIPTCVRKKDRSCVLVIVSTCKTQWYRV